MSAPDFELRQKGMLTELLEEGSPYGPVHRLWFDGAGSQRPAALLDPATQAKYFDSCFELIRTTSPDTLISPYRGDVCISTGRYNNLFAAVPIPTASRSNGGERERECLQSRPCGGQLVHERGPEAELVRLDSVREIHRDRPILSPDRNAWRDDARGPRRSAATRRAAP